MPNFILKLFIKNYEDTENPAVRANYGTVAGIFGILSNFMLFILKIIIGIFSKSVSITADAINNLTDSASSIVTLIGFKMSRKPADEEHPYGHARMEYLSGLFVSLLVVFIGFQFFKESLVAIFNPVENEFNVFTVVVLLFSVAIKLWQGIVNRSVGKKINSTALIATSVDSIGDVIATATVLVGIVVSMIFNVVLDGYLGIAVAVFILVSGIRLMKEAIDPILGSAPAHELVKKISDKIMTYDGVLGYHDLVVHNYGEGRCFASVHVEVPADRDIMQSHDIIDNIEYDFKRNDNLHVVIHLDPVEVNNPVVNALRTRVESMLGDISNEISMHDFRIVSGKTHSNILFDVSVPFSFAMSDAELRYTISKRIKKIDPHYNTVLTIDRNYTSTTK